MFEKRGAREGNWEGGEGEKEARRGRQTNRGEGGREKTDSLK